MSAAEPITLGEGRVIPLAAARQGRRLLRSRRTVTALAVLALCLLGLMGSFADSALARTGLFLIDPPYPGSADNLAATLVLAIIANLGVCAGVVMLAYWLLSWPSAQIVDLRSQRTSSKP